MLTPSLIALVAAVVGGFVAHFLTARRDRLNKTREKKIDYLIEAYRRLEKCAQRKWPKKEKDAQAEFSATMEKLESALADIQLFGSPEQVRLAQEFAREFAEKGSSDLDELLKDLRRDLRQELNLPEVPLGILHLRFHKDN